MNSSQKSVCIIGGGFAGLAAAVFLDSAGFRVKLYERRPILGGRAYAFKDRKTDTWVDNGQHLMMGAYHETIRLLEMIGSKHHLHFQNPTRVPMISEDGDHQIFSVPNLPIPINFLWALLRFPSFTWKDRWNGLRLGMDLRRKKNISDKTVSEWLKDYQSERVQRNFWDILTLATLNDDPQVACASALRIVLQKSLLSSQYDSRLVFPKSNLNDVLAKPAQTYLEMRGQEIFLSTAVKKIHILDQRVQALELANGEKIRADYYFSAVPFHHLLGLLPEGYIHQWPYFKNLMALKSAPIVSINLWFDREVMPDHFVGVGGAKIHWYFNRNRIHARLAPLHHYVGVISGAYEFLETSKDEIIRTTLAEMQRIYPEVLKASLVHCLVNKEREATLSPGVGSEALRPDPKSPVENLFVIGDWTRTGLPATIESAVVSARMAVDYLGD